ncbi:hypothetical protein Bca101_005233 [Brassica carinata]
MDQPHALLVASPGLGHLIPILELGNRLSSVLKIHVTILAVTSGSSPIETEAIRAAVARGTCEVRELPSIDIDHSPDATVPTKIIEMMRATKTKTAVQDAVKSMNRKPTVMIIDIFGTGLMSIADDIGVNATYVYVPSHAWFLAVVVYTPVLDRVVEGEYTDIKEPMKIPGCRPVGPDELLETMEDGELSRVMKAPVYGIGPIVRSSGPTEKADNILEWLDKQPDKSVVFVCLGSGGTLSLEQTMELAYGLDLSGQRFLWVLRRPTSYLGASSSDDGQVSAGLPEGFLDGTRGVGLVVTQWAPQVEILSHGSIGGFLSHCGWSY